MKIVKPALLALICAVLLAMTHARTRDTIAENRILHAQQLLREMVGENVDIVEGEGESTAFSPDGQIVATIRSISTFEGYNGRIDLLVALSPDNQVLSVRTIYHQETPGLGDKIDHRVSDWIHQFEGTSMETAWALKPEGDIDGITGATITARATLQAIEGNL